MADPRTDPTAGIGTTRTGTGQIIPITACTQVDDPNSLSLNANGQHPSLDPAILTQIKTITNNCQARPHP